MYSLIIGATSKGTLNCYAWLSVKLALSILFSCFFSMIKYMQIKRWIHIIETEMSYSLLLESYHTEGFVFIWFSLPDLWPWSCDCDFILRWNDKFPLKLFIINVLCDLLCRFDMRFYHTLRINFPWANTVSVLSIINNLAITIS